MADSRTQNANRAKNSYSTPQFKDAYEALLKLIEVTKTKGVLYIKVDPNAPTEDDPTQPY